MWRWPRRTQAICWRSWRFLRLPRSKPISPSSALCTSEMVDGVVVHMDNDSNCAQSIGTENPKCQFNFIQKRRRRWLHRFFHQGTGWQCKREEQLLLPLKRTYPGALMHHNSGWWEARWSWSARRNWTSWYCSSCGKDVGFWWWWSKINDGSMQHWPMMTMMIKIMATLINKAFMVSDEQTSFHDIFPGSVISWTAKVEERADLTLR